MKPEEVVTIFKWNHWKSCPKCDHPNLTTGTYYPPGDGLPEHLSIQCRSCGYQYRMATKS